MTNTTQKIENDYMTAEQRRVYEKYPTYAAANDADEGAIYNLVMANYDRLNGIGL